MLELQLSGSGLRADDKMVRTKTNTTLPVLSFGSSDKAYHKQ